MYQKIHLHIETYYLSLQDAGTSGSHPPAAGEEREEEADDDKDWI